jgi:hypothetical protein
MTKGWHILHCGINLLVLIGSTVTAALQIVSILKILFMSVFRRNETLNISNGSLVFHFSFGVTFNTLYPLVGNSDIYSLS